MAKPCFRRHRQLAIRQIEGGSQAGEKVWEPTMGDKVRQGYRKLQENTVTANAWQALWSMTGVHDWCLEREPVLVKVTLLIHHAQRVPVKAGMESVG